MATNLEDGIHGLLLKSMLPLLVATPGSAPSGRPRLRGVVRADEARTRVALTRDERMTSGVAAEFALRDLVRDGRLVGVEAAVDHVRTTLAVDLDRYQVAPSLARDSHHNVIVPVPAAELAGGMEAGAPDVGLFRMLNLFEHGGDAAWFSDVYTFIGFMLQPGDRCRIYLRVEKSGEVSGIDIPLTHSDRTPIFGIGGSLVQELASLVRVGDLSIQPKMDSRDDYCRELFDMSGWVDPPHPTPRERL